MNFRVCVKVLSSLLFCATAFAQLSIQSPLIDSSKQLQPVRLTYTLPSTNDFLIASRNNPSMAPASIIWYWNDEAKGATQKHFTQVDYKPENVQIQFYKPPTGYDPNLKCSCVEYSVGIIVLDKKGRSMEQAVYKLRLSVPVEVVQ